MQSPPNARMIARLALMLAIALVIQYIESLLPYPIPLVPIHIGLANIVILYVLKNDGKVAAFIVGILRCLLIALILGRTSALLYSLSGTLLSIGAMCLVLNRKGVSLYGTSVLGAFMFNLGQLAVGLLIIGTSILPLVPWFGLLSIPCGLITAFLAARIPKW